MMYSLSKSIFGAILFVLTSQTAMASLTNWTIQSASSSLTISGALSSGGTFLASVVTQAAGSLTTSYSGTIVTDLDPLSSIQFLGGSVVAGNSGSWDPLPTFQSGTAPANYGTKVDLGFLGGSNQAIRDLTNHLTSDDTLLSGVAPATQSFSAELDLEIDTGSIVYRGFGIIGGDLTQYDPFLLAGTTASFNTTGTIAYGSGGVATLTIPIAVPVNLIVANGDTTTTADDIGVYYTFTGQYVATAVVPEANALVLLGMATSAVGYLGYRRRQRST